MVTHLGQSGPRVGQKTLFEVWVGPGVSNYSGTVGRGPGRYFLHLVLNLAGGAKPFLYKERFNGSGATGVIA